ncbi:Myb_DNA-bind_7 domain-containing protein [Meloidogyne graminicola]|uniref:Myb_DNA-bind_7 domain-containing protein n=1 Tax=Meloidogyne graminicola TaxID=189291 RepID=A0A8S9ZAL1_9BILA|nr:Myb_DNA-bind_7 domain-containing protein [Meloidogyne graminicola]
MRRLKIQVKPNQNSSKPKNDVEEVKRTKTEETKYVEENNNNLNKIQEKTNENVQESQQQQKVCEENNVFTNSTTSLESVVVSNNEYVRLNEVVSTESITSLTNMEHNNNYMFENVVSEKQTNRIHLPPLLSASSNSSQQQINLPSNLGSPQKYEKNEANNNEKKLKERPKEKLCDTKKFTMADLVKWRPRTENTFRKKWSTKRKNDEEEKETISSKTDDSDDLSTANSLTPKKGILEEEERKTPTSGPRVRINEQGEMVVDEDSLIVMQNPENTQLETVINDDVAPKKLTSMSFRKRSRGSIWGVLETDLFYEVLAATGTDFGLMHEFIPNRSRIELKQKFNREHRVNPKRMDEALRNPVLLDGRLRQRVERFHAEMAK